MKINLKILTFIFFPVLFFAFFSCSAIPPRFEKILGTVCVVNLYEDGTEKKYDEIFARLKQIHEEFSLRDEKSDLNRINSCAFYEAVSVGSDVFSVIESAQFISSLTEGKFDISIEPLVSLWRINTENPHIASQSEIDSLLPLVDYKNIILDSEKKSVRFLKKGMSIDLGGIAKGFAADEIAKICKKNKIRRAVIDLGGNIYVYGKKSKKTLWNVGIKNPEYPDDVPCVRLSLPENSVVTSGVYERFFVEDEKRYHHILSPETGFPADNNLYSVTVICKNSMIADALSTAFFVLGKEKSLASLSLIQEKLKSAYGDVSEISAVFIENNHKITFSENFPYDYEILTETWNIGDI